MYKPRFLCICLILALWAAFPLPAQVGQVSGEDDVFTYDRCVALTTKNTRTDQVPEEERDAPLAVAGVSPAVTTAAALIASEKNGRGVISFSGNRESSEGMEDDWAVTVSAPFNKAEGEASIASLTGLAGDVVATASFTRFRWNLKPRTYAENLCGRCRSLQMQKLSECFGANVGEVMKRVNGATDEEAQEVVNKLSDSLFGMNATTMWGLEAAVGRKERAFFAADTTKKEENRVGYSAALFGSWDFVDAWSIYGRLTGKRDYKENSKVNLCSPVNGSILEACSSLPFGEAEEQENFVASAELRRFFQTFAISPAVEYDFEAGVWGFRLPIFLVRNSDGDFTGGVRFSWQTDEEDLVTAVFVGVPLG